VSGSCVVALRSAGRQPTAEIPLESPGRRPIIWNPRGQSRGREPNMFSAPKLLVALGILFLLFVLPAMAAVAVCKLRKARRDG